MYFNHKGTEMKFRIFSICVSIVMVLWLMVSPLELDAQRSRSSGFGGSRSSSSSSSSSYRSSSSSSSATSQPRSSAFGGNRSTTSSPSTSSSSSKPSSAFGGTRSTSPSASRPSTSTSNSFGGTKSTNSPSYATPRSGGTSLNGNRMTSTQAASSYGTPRRTYNQTYGGSNIRVNDYGGFSSGLMAGYLAGRIMSPAWHPFSGSFYYGRPTYVYGPNGQIESVYPPTFSFFKLFLALAILGAIIFVIYKIVTRNRNKEISNSSFS